MLIKLIKFFGVIAAVLVLAGTTQVAAKPELKKTRFFGSPDNAPEVRVGAENGRWVVLKSPGILYKFNYHVEANRPLKSIMVGAGNDRPGLTAPWWRGQISSSGNLQRTAWGEGTFFLPNGRIGGDSGKVKAACNKLLEQGKTTSREHETFAELELVPSVSVRSAPFHSGETVFNRIQATTTVKVICEAEPSKIQAPPKPYSVDVQVEQNGETCPNKTDVTAIIKYRVPATARFRFKVDGKLSKVHEIKARKIEPDKPQSGPGGGAYYEVKRLKTYYLDPGQTNFRVVMEDGSGKKSAVKTVKVTCPRFEVTSAWLTYNVSDKLTCAKEVHEKATFNTTRPGSLRYRIKHQGGLVVAEGKIKAKRKGMKYVATAKRTLMMNTFEGEFMAEVVDDTANSGWVPVRVDCLELSGDFSFLDSGGTRCPREGRALINFGMNIPATIHWSLDCNIGNYSGVAQAVSDNKGGYVAPALALFNIDKTTQVTCALKSVSPIKKAHALKWKAYQCIIPSGVSGANGLKPETRPEPDTPRQPDKVVVTPPRQPGANGRLDEIVVTGSKTEVACHGGTPKNGKCLCDRTRKPVKVGKKAFRCVKTVIVDPVKTDKGDKRADSTPDYPKKTRGDAEADKKRLEALKRKQAQEARRKAAEAEKRRKALAAQKAAREARKKAAEAAKRKQQLKLRKARMKAMQQARSVKVKKRRKKRKRRAK